MWRGKIGVMSPDDVRRKVLVLKRRLLVVDRLIDAAEQYQRAARRRPVAEIVADVPRRSRGVERAGWRAA